MECLNVESIGGGIIIMGVVVRAAILVGMIVGMIVGIIGGRGVSDGVIIDVGDVIGG